MHNLQFHVPLFVDCRPDSFFFSFCLPSLSPNKLFSSRSTRPFPVPSRVERPFCCETGFAPSFRPNSERSSENLSQLGRSGTERLSFESLLWSILIYFVSLFTILASISSLLENMRDSFWSNKRQHGILLGQVG